MLLIISGLFPKEGTKMSILKINPTPGGDTHFCQMMVPETVL